MGNWLTPEQISEILKKLQKVGNRVQQTSEEAANERSSLMFNLYRLNGKGFSSMQLHEVFELGAAIGKLTKHCSSAVRDRAIITLRELKKNTEAGSHVGNAGPRTISNSNTGGFINTFPHPNINGPIHSYHQFFDGANEQQNTSQQNDYYESLTEDDIKPFIGLIGDTVKLPQSSQFSKN